MGKSMKAKKMGVAKSLVKKAGRGPKDSNPGLNIPDKILNKIPKIPNKIPIYQGVFGPTKMKGR